MTKKTVLNLILIFWAIAFIGSFVAFQLTAPTGDSFARGLNRIATFFGWQFVATLLLVAAIIAGRGFPRGSALRRASFVPAAGLALLILALLAVVLWAQFGVPDPLPGPQLTPVPTG